MRQLQNDLLLRVLAGRSVSRPPVWMMRQAGRYLPEYLHVRKQAGSFRQMLANPSYAAEVTLQPVDILGVDAAIIFSDILVLAEAIGVPFQMEEQKGPVFPTPLQDLTQLHEANLDANLKHTLLAIEEVRRSLGNRLPLIGFAGAPWTIFAYMTEGSGSKTFSKAKSLLYRSSQFSHQALEKITTATITYLNAQIDCGVDAIQLFDSWAGLLSPEAYTQYALPYLAEICRQVTRVPVIVFAKGAFFALPEIATLSCAGIGLDWNTSPAYCQGFKQALQGNLDPCVLYADPEKIQQETLKMLKTFPAGRHIANLGHGIYPDIPVENAQTFIKTVQSFLYP